MAGFLGGSPASALEAVGHSARTAAVGRSDSLFLEDQRGERNITVRRSRVDTALYGENIEPYGMIPRGGPGRLQHLRSTESTSELFFAAANVAATIRATVALTFGPLRPLNV